MIFHILIAGYGFSFQIGGYDIVYDQLTIFSWSVIRDHVVWRAEHHTRTESNGYNYRCIKNGKTVENISFRSPVVSNM